MQIVLRSISYFRKDLWLIATLLVLIGASVLLNLLNAWPMAILVDTVLSPTPKPNWIHSYAVSCPVRRRQAERNFRNGDRRDDHQDPERYRHNAP